MKISRLLRPAVVSMTVSLLTVFAPGGFAQTSTNTIPVVTIYATSPHATWTGTPGVFTVFRSGDPVPSLNVYCCIGGTASNGVDYQSISHFVSLASGVMSNTVVINPINLGQTNVETVVLDLCPSPLMTPVNYSIGSPSEAVVYITPPDVSNLPPAVAMINPTNDEVYHVPVSIPLLARASDPDGSVTNVEFFAGTNDLGRGQLLVLDPPGMYGYTGPVYYLNWLNVPTNSYTLTAIASDNEGAPTVSTPVNITVLGANSNLPPIVRIINPPNLAVFHAPVYIPIFAYAADFDGSVTTVQFFADGNSLGFGQRVTVPPISGASYPIFYPSNYWELTWSNAPIETNITLTAEATDDGGASTISPPVLISVLPSPPPPTNRPPFVGIVASDPVAIEGTNCWPWLALAGSTPCWSNWTSATATFQLRTNCGPKNASFTVFRIGVTNDDLNVTYAIGGSATNGVDYVMLPGNVLIPAGERSAMIPVMPIDDGPPDITSSVVLKLTPGTNYWVGYPRTAAAVILDGSSPRPATGIVPGNLFHLCSIGPDGAWFHVEHSTDLVNWIPLCTNQVINGSLDFIDPDAATQPERFYRAVSDSSAPVQ